MEHHLRGDDDLAATSGICSSGVPPKGSARPFYYPASMSLISDYHGRDTRSRAMGLHQTSVYVGTIGGGFFAGLIGQYYGWRLSFIVFGGLGILLGLVLQPLPGRTCARRRGRDRSRPAPTLRHRRRGGAVAAQFLRLVAPHADAALPDGRVHVRELRRRGAPVVDAQVPVRQVPHGPGDGGLTATIFVQLASMAGAPVGGWLADMWRRRTAARPPGCADDWRARRRPVRRALRPDAVCRHADRCASTVWGFFKGLYDANIFASVFDVVRPEARGTAAGFMNAVGWLAGGGSAPLAIGIIAQRESLGLAIALASTVYVAAGLLLPIGLRSSSSVTRHGCRRS